MSCDWVQHHLDAYELGGLTPAERATLEAHVASCEACRQLVAEAPAELPEGGRYRLPGFLGDDGGGDVN